MNGYPYPVLTEVDSSYKENVNFNIEFLKYDYDAGKVKLTLGINLTSEFLKKHIQSGDAKLVIKTVTNIRSQVYALTECLEHIEILLESQNIRANDVIEITAYVIANRPFVLQMNNEFEEYFGDSFSITLRKGDLLAISNTEKLNYNTTNNDFIKIVGSSERNGQGIQIRLNDNIIEILVGDDFKRSYVEVKDAKISPILNSHLIFEAIVYTLVEIAQRDKEEYCNCEWYRLFSQAYLATGETLDDFKDKVVDEGNVDISYVYKVAQQMISNSLEMAVINVSRIGD